MEFCFACECGDVCEGEAPEPSVKAVRELWSRVHYGPGHARVDKATAVAISLRADDEEARFAALVQDALECAEG